MRPGLVKQIQRYIFDELVEPELVSECSSIDVKNVRKGIRVRVKILHQRVALVRKKESVTTIL
jgi:hypothetical protein